MKGVLQRAKAQLREQLQLTAAMAHDVRCLMVSTNLLALAWRLVPPKN